MCSNGTFGIPPSSWANVNTFTTTSKAHISATGMTGLMFYKNEQNTKTPDICVSPGSQFGTPSSAGPLTRAGASRPSETSRLHPHSPHSGFSATANPTISFLRKKLAGNFSSQPIKSLDVFLGTQAPVSLAHKPLLCLLNGLSKAFRCPGGSPVQAPLLTSCHRDDAPGFVFGPALVLTMDMAPADDPGSGSRVGHQDVGERCPPTTELCSLSRSSSSHCPKPLWVQKYLHFQYFLR